MKNPSESLAGRVKEKRDALIEIDRKREILLAELRAYEDALGLYSEAAPAATPTKPIAPQPMPQPRPIRADFARRIRSKGKRGLSINWKAVLAGMVRSDQASFTYDDLIKIAADLGFNIEKPTARSRVAQYVAVGYLQREGEGIFRVAQKGLDAVHGTLGKQEAPIGVPTSASDSRRH